MDESKKLKMTISELFYLQCPIPHWDTRFANVIVSLYLLLNENEAVYRQYQAQPDHELKRQLLTEFQADRSVKIEISSMLDHKLKQLLSAITEIGSPDELIEGLQTCYQEFAPMDGEFKTKNLVNLLATMARRILEEPSKITDKYNEDHSPDTTNSTSDKLLFIPCAGFGDLGYEIGWTNTLSYEGYHLTHELGTKLARLKQFTSQYHNRYCLYRPLETTVNADLIILTLDNAVPISNRQLQTLQQANFRIDAIPASCDTVSNWIQLGLFHLNPTGKILVSSNTSWLSDRKSQKLRQYLVQQNLIETIMVLPRTFNRDARQRKIIMILNKNKAVNRQNHIGFLDAFELTMSQKHLGANQCLPTSRIETLINLVLVHESPNDLVTKVSLDQILAIKCNLNPKRYIA